MSVLKASPRNVFLSFVFAGLGVASCAAYAEETTEIAHPFFTHEGLLDAVGSYSTRLSSWRHGSTARQRVISPFTSRPD